MMRVFSPIEIQSQSLFFKATAPEYSGKSKSAQERQKSVIIGECKVAKTVRMSVGKSV